VTEAGMGRRLALRERLYVPRCRFGL